MFLVYKLEKKVIKAMEQGQNSMSDVHIQKIIKVMTFNEEMDREQK